MGIAERTGERRQDGARSPPSIRASQHSALCLEVRIFQAWQQILTEDPNHALAHRGLGVIAFLDGDPARALTDLQAAEISDPFDPVTRFYMGLALKMTGDMVQAKAEFERAAFLGSDPELVRQAQANLEALR